MIEFDFEGYAKSKIDKGLGYLEGFSKGYHQAKSEWVGLSNDEISIQWFKIFDAEPGVGKNITNGIFEFAKALESVLKNKNI
jgi:hypothetical protein